MNAKLQVRLVGVICAVPAVLLLWMAVSPFVVAEIHLTGEARCNEQGELRVGGMLLVPLPGTGLDHAEIEGACGKDVEVRGYPATYDEGHFHPLEVRSSERSLLSSSEGNTIRVFWSVAFFVMGALCMLGAVNLLRASRVAIETVKGTSLAWESEAGADR